MAAEIAVAAIRTCRIRSVLCDPIGDAYDTPKGITQLEATPNNPACMSIVGEPLVYPKSGWPLLSHAAADEAIELPRKAWLPIKPGAAGDENSLQSLVRFDPKAVTP